MTATFDPRNGPRHLSSQAFLTLGALRIAYVRPVEVEGRQAYAVHAADGATLAVVGSRDIAFITARQCDLEPVSVH